MIPQQLESAILRILDGPQTEWAEGLQQLEAKHPDLAAAIREKTNELQAHFVENEADTTAARSEQVGGPVPSHIDSYRILKRLGEGGMGTVYLAEQDQPIRRRVAIKLIKPGMDSKAVVARFEQERQALALMEHHAIAKVFDCGTSETGQPYFVMEVVHGVPLDTYCEQQRLSLVERIRLVQQVCGAVTHAHQKGVVHRDLKPGNILVHAGEEDPQIKIIDFGLAKALEDKLADASMLTEIGQMLGTPEYMAPEQADVGNADIDTRADVYSLGVVLYQLLVDQLPFSSEQLRSGGLTELQRVLMQVEPPRPSARLSQQTDELAARRGLSSANLAKALRTDLDWVVLKAMEKDRDDRYETAHALSVDLQRFLDHEPLLAGPPSLRYRLRKLARRYRAVVGASAAVLLALLAGGIATYVQYERAETRAQENAELASSERQAKNRALELKQEADAQAAANARLADEKDQLARSEAAEKRKFWELSGLLEYERVMRNEAGLYPAWPDRLPSMDAWIEEADALLAKRPAVLETIGSLRASALPASPEELAEDRRTHPLASRHQLLAKRLVSLRYAASVRAGEIELPTVRLTGQTPSYSGHTLTRLAWECIAPAPFVRKNWRQEPPGLACARAAVKKEPSPKAIDTLAWALLANGQDEEAREVAAKAVAAAPTWEREAYEESQRRLEAAIAQAPDILARMEREVAALETELTERRTWRFADEPEQQARSFLHDSLVQLVGELDSLEQARARVDKRRTWARQVERATHAHPNAAHSWQAARSAIAASERYRDAKLELPDEVVTGLVPIGENPATGLWEFYDLRSAWDGESDPMSLPIPRHAEDGRIEVSGATGIVFALLPGGTVTLGSQAHNPSAPFFYDNRQENEAIYEIELHPFLLARHEMTQGQWARLWTWDPAKVEPSGAKGRGIQGRLSRAHPVEQVDWWMCDQLVRCHGMVLPTESQWEYACRGGTTTPWSVPLEQLRNVANVADATAGRAIRTWECEAWADGHISHAPVGLFAANAFGMHDMHGNLYEWCRDTFGEPDSGRAGDGYREHSVDTNYIFRGGSYNGKASFSRSAVRYSSPASFVGGDIGLRPARAVR